MARELVDDDLWGAVHPLTPTSAAQNACRVPATRRSARLYRHSVHSAYRIAMETAA